MGNQTKSPVDLQVHKVECIFKDVNFWKPQNAHTVGGRGESALGKPYCFLHRQFLPTQIYARLKSFKAKKEVVHYIPKL